MNALVEALIPCGAMMFGFFLYWTVTAPCYVANALRFRECRTWQDWAAGISMWLFLLGGTATVGWVWERTLR